MSDLDYIFKFGSSGSGNSNLSTPKGIAVSDNFVWVCDSGNNRVKKLTRQGLQFVAHITGLSAPEDVIYWDGLIFISNTGANNVKVALAHNGTIINTISGLSSPRGIAANRKWLWIANAGTNTILKYDLETFTLSETGGSAGTGNKQLDSPRQIAYDPHERQLYIVDSGNSRVLKWDAHGFEYRDKITGLSSPVGIDFAKHFFYVSQLNTLTAYSAATNEVMDSYGTSGSGDENISAGGYVRVFDDMIFFSDTGNHRIMVRQNYNPRRAYTSYQSPTIDGDWFSNPNIPIGGEQEGEGVTIEGSANSDKFRWIEPIAEKKIGWQAETEVSSTWTAE